MHDTTAICNKQIYTNLEGGLEGGRVYLRGVPVRGVLGGSGLMCEKQGSRNSVTVALL